MSNISELKIAVASHEFFKGSPQELREYLLKKHISSLTYVAHQFSYLKDSISYKEAYSKGKLVKKSESIKVKGRELFIYLRDFIYGFIYLIFTKEKYDVYVGIDSFNALFGVLLKLLGKSKISVFFTIDYVMKNRFKSTILSKIYVIMDRIAFFYSDYTWNVSDRMSTQRIKELGSMAKRKPQLVVPIGVPIEEARSINITKKSNVLVYSGSLMPEYGLEILFESLPIVIKEIPDIELRILGSGPLEQKLKALTAELKIEKNVNFVGYINTLTDRIKWLSLLKESTLGMAMYEPTPNTFKRFSDVTKPKDYFACGLPVITTSVIPLSEDVINQNLGRVVEFNKESLAREVIKLLIDKEEYEKVSNNVLKFSENFTWEKIFDRTFTSMNISV